nr:YciK family oxidoreductase [Pectobacterium polaris]
MKRGCFAPRQEEFIVHYQPKIDLLQNRIILVTGAGDGIGREATLTYARYGAHVILLGRTESKLQSVKQQIEQEHGTPAHVVVCDMLALSSAQCFQLADELAQVVPHLDGVLHNAGLLGEITPITQQTPEIWHQVMQVNVNATFMLTQALLPLLLKSPCSSLVFTSSSVGREGRAGWGAYSVSKFATEGLMQVLAEEYRSHNLRVNCINPGGTRTGMRASAFPNEDPMRLKTPADIMPLYLYLMGDDSRRKTGMSFDAQPGRKAGPAE